jgi:hypothetical protein
MKRGAELMSFLRSLGWSRLSNRNTPPGIDLGDGRQLRPEDVLEGHFRRLAASTGESEELRVQVTPTLSAAIRVMAPQLAPLAQIAEELASTFPTVSPAPAFRRDLHQALELAHRQHTAQRTVGALPPGDAANHSHWWIWMTVGVVLAGGVFAGVWAAWQLGRRRLAHKPSS